MAVELKQKTSGYLVDAVTFRQNVWKKWMEYVQQTDSILRGLELV